MRMYDSQAYLVGVKKVGRERAVFRLTLNTPPETSLVGLFLYGSYNYFFFDFKLRFDEYNLKYVLTENDVGKLFRQLCEDFK